MWLKAGFTVRMRCCASVMTMASPLLWNTCAASRSSASRAPRQGDVEQEPLERAAAVRPGHHADQLAQPEPMAVRRQEPILQLVVLAARQAGAAELDDGIALSGVELAAPEPRGTPRLRRVARDLFDLRADVGEALLLGVGGPGHHLGGLHQAAKALLARLELVLGALALGDVLDRPDHPARAPALVEHHVRPRVHVTRAAVGQHHPIVDGERRQPRLRILRGALEPRQILRDALSRTGIHASGRSCWDRRRRCDRSLPTRSSGCCTGRVPSCPLCRPAAPSAARPRARAGPPRRASAR